MIEITDLSNWELLSNFNPPNYDLDHGELEDKFNNHITVSSEITLTLNSYLRHTKIKIGNGDLSFHSNCFETFPTCCETFPECCESFPDCCESFPECCKLNVLFDFLNIY